MLQLESITVVPNSIVSILDCDLNSQENLKSLYFQYCNFQPNFVINNLKISNCQELNILNFNFSTGLNLVPITTTNTIVLPLEYGELTKLANIIFSNCGFSGLQIENLIIALDKLTEGKPMIIQGREYKMALGTAINTPTIKTINFSGENGKPDLTKPNVLASKNAIISRGWNLIINQ